MPIDFEELAQKYMQKELNRLNKRISYLKVDVDERGINSPFVGLLHHYARKKVALLNDMKVLQV